MFRLFKNCEVFLALLVVLTPVWLLLLLIVFPAYLWDGAAIALFGMDLLFVVFSIVKGFKTRKKISEISMAVSSISFVIWWLLVYFFTSVHV